MNHIDQIKAYYGKTADWEAGEKGEKKSGPGVGKGEGSDVPDGEGNTAKRASEKPRHLIFSDKSKAQAFVKSLDKNEVRGKYSVRKTKGWNTYSVVFTPHAYSDVVAIMKQYKPEKKHYEDIAKEMAKAASEDVSGPFRVRVTHVVTAADLYVAVSGNKLLGATDGSHGSSKSGWKGVERVRKAPSYEILKVKNVPQNVAVNMVDWGSNNPKTSFWKDEETAYKAVERYLKKGEKVAADKTAADIDAAYTAAIVKELKRMAGSLGIAKMKQKSKGSGGNSARRQIQLNFADAPMIDLWVGRRAIGMGPIGWSIWAAYGTVRNWYDEAKAPLTGDLRQDVRAISIALKEYVETAAEQEGISWRRASTKTAGNAGGLYGFPKALQNDCDVASRRVAKAAVRIAKSAYKKDARVAEFLNTHAKRSKSVPAKALVAAFAEMGPKIASTDTERLQELRDKQASTNKEARNNGKNNKEYLDSLPAPQRDHMLSEIAKHYGISPQRAYEEVTDRDAEKLFEYLAFNRTLATVVYGDFRNFRFASNKEAKLAYGLYGYYDKTSRLGLNACAELRHEAGVVASNLHRRRAAKHARISEYLSTHCKKARCAYSRLILDGYPEAEMRLASETPKTVDEWISWED